MNKWNKLSSSNKFFFILSVILLSIFIFIEPMTFIPITVGIGLGMIIKEMDT